VLPSLCCDVLDCTSCVRVLIAPPLSLFARCCLCVSLFPFAAAVVWPYPRDILGAEAATLSFLAVIDAGRMALGHKGNLTQSRLPLGLFAILCCPVMLGHIFFLQYQTYVMRLDQIINAIALVFVCGEVLLAIFIILAVLSLRIC
jgi:hypothetical protein